MAVIRNYLFKVNHTVWASGANHRISIDPIHPMPCKNRDVITQFLNPVFRVAPVAVDSEHASARTASKGRVLGVVIKAEIVTGLILKNESWNFSALDAQQFLAVLYFFLEGFTVGVAWPMAAGNDSQCTGVASL